MAVPPKSAPKSAPSEKAASSAEPEAPVAPKKKSKRLLIAVIGIVALLLLGGGGGAAWYFLKDSGEDHATAAADKDKGKGKGKEAAKNLKPPVFVNLEPFTVNLASEGSDRYLQTTIVLQMSDDKSAEAIKVYMPVIRDRVLRLLSSKRTSEIDSGDGKQKLVAELVTVARESVPGSTAEHGSVGALFSTFVIQ